MVKGRLPRGGAGIERLKAFLEAEMTMSHIYQPVMIRTILQCGGAASKRQIAAAFSASDLSQLEYYEQILRRYPGPILRKRDIVELDNDVYRLARDLRDMDEWQRALLISLCDAKIANFVSTRQAATWAHRSSNAAPLPGSVRWQVIARAMGHCEACGVSSEVRAIEVDHIIPRSRGGSNELINLQALCSLCNVQKLDRDQTNFRLAHAEMKHLHENCCICQLLANDGSLAGVVQLPDGLAVAPRRHGVGWLDLWQPEVNALRQVEATAGILGSLMRTEILKSELGEPGHLVLKYSE